MAFNVHMAANMATSRFNWKNIDVSRHIAALLSLLCGQCRLTAATLSGQRTVCQREEALT
jgi:hypothetical protein